MNRKLTSRHLVLKTTCFFAIAIVAFSLFPSVPVNAQSTGFAAITNIVTDQFPVITFNMTAHAANGTFIEKLNIDTVSVLEDGLSRNIDNIKYSDPGMQFILAVNAAPSLGYFAGGVVRFENIRQALVTWINNRPVQANDDFSLVTNQDALAQRVAGPLDFLTFVENYKPDFAKSTPSTAALSRALDLAMTANPRPSMQRSIFYITPLPETADLLVLQALADRAVQQNVHLFIWMTAYNSSASSPEAVAMQAIAARTGGQYFQYTGLEKLPDPESWLGSLRGLYLVSYSSHLSKSGTHSLAAEVKTGSGDITSAPQTIELTILPPEVSFVSPPSSIERSWLNDSPGTSLQPQSVNLAFLVKFPDGYERELKKARLLVDGQVVQEIIDLTNKQFTWQLPESQSSSQHTLRIQVVDSLDLTGQSSELTIDVNIKTIQRTGWQIFMSSLFSGEHVVIFIAVILSAAALITILVLSSRGYRIRLSRRPSRKETHDPVTQPVFIHAEKNKPAVSNRQVNLAPPAPGIQFLARFVPADQSGKKMDTSKSLVITQPDVTLGRDSRQVDVVISAPSVSPLHARLHLDETGVYILSDAGSVGGTWVNYAPVSSQGVHLEHNDLVNFAKLSFRFEIIRSNGNHKPIH